MNNIARNLRNARMKKGYTQEQAALEIGCSVQSIIRWENGITNMAFKDAISLSKLYDVTLDAIAYGKK